MSGTGLRWTLASALLAVFIGFLVVGGGGGAPGTYTAPTRLVTVLATALALIAFAIVAARDPRWRPASAIWPALVAVLLVFVLSTLTSWNPRLSVEMTAQVVLLIGLYLLLRQLFRSPFFEPRILVLTAGLSAIVGLAFLVSVFSGWIDWWSLSGGLSIPPLRPGYGGLTYGSPNAVAAVVVLFMAPAAAWLSSGSGRRRAIAVSLVVLAALVTFLSGSRGAWLGFAAASR